MGIFWTYSAEPRPSVVDSFKTALAKPAVSGNALDNEASERAAAVADTTAPANLNWKNLIVAIILVLALLGTAIGTDAANLPNSSKALYAIATTAFGLIFGLLTGEKPKS
jgi:hypothetical protein